MIKRKTDQDFDYQNFLRRRLFYVYIYKLTLNRPKCIQALLKKKKKKKKKFCFYFTCSNKFQRWLAISHVPGKTQKILRESFSQYM